MAGSKRTRSQANTPSSEQDEQPEQQQQDGQQPAGQQMLNLQLGTTPGDDGPAPKKQKIMRITAPVAGVMRLEIPIAANGAAANIVTSDASQQPPPTEAAGPAPSRGRGSGCQQVSGAVAGPTGGEPAGDGASLPDYESESQSGEPPQEPSAPRVPIPDAIERLLAGYRPGDPSATDPPSADPSAADPPAENDRPIFADQLVATPSPLTTADRITVGVEIELLAECPRLIKLNAAQYNQWLNDGLLLHHVIRSRLVAEGLARRELPAGPGYDQWQVKADESIGRHTENRTWAIKGHCLTDVELVSRVCPNVAIATAEVRAAFAGIGVLAGTFHTNETTGLHVHLGFGNVGIPFETLHRFARLVVAFEHRLNVLVPAHRLLDDDGHVPLACVPPSQLATFTDGIEGSSRQRLEQRLARATACTTTAQLGALFNPVDAGAGGVPSCGVAYNLLPLTDGADARNTIELRQFPASSQPETCVAYVRLAAALLRYAHDADEDALNRDLLDHYLEREFSVWDLLNVLDPQLGDVFEEQDLVQHDVAYLAEHYPMPWSAII